MIRFTHDAQVIPSTGNETISMGWLVKPGWLVWVMWLRAVDTPGEYVLTHRFGEQGATPYEANRGYPPPVPAPATRQPTVATVVAAPWGPVRLAASATGLVALDQLVTGEAFDARIERRFGAPPVDVAEAGGDSRLGGASDMLLAAVRALERFLDGQLTALDGLVLDLRDRSGWDRLVLAAVREIPPGATASYGEVARMIGKAGAARAVGGAVGRNPVGLVIPCHRVIAGDGTLGGYGGGWWGGRQAGLDLKRELLAREGVVLER